MKTQIIEGKYVSILASVILKLKLIVKRKTFEES